METELISPQEPQTQKPHSPFADQQNVLAMRQQVNSPGLSAEETARLRKDIRDAAQQNLNAATTIIGNVLQRNLTSEETAKLLTGTDPKNILKGAGVKLSDEMLDTLSQQSPTEASREQKLSQPTQPQPKQKPERPVLTSDQKEKLLAKSKAAVYTPEGQPPSSPKYRGGHRKRPLMYVGRRRA